MDTEEIKKEFQDAIASTKEEESQADPFAVDGLGHTPEQEECGGGES